MSVQRVKAFLEQKNYADRIILSESSTATVPLAAAVLGVNEGAIAKTVSLYQNEDHAILVVCAGDGKIDNKKFKDTFGLKAKMLKAEDVERLTSFLPGGVCPFATPTSTSVYLDRSLLRFETIYPACGDDHSMTRFTPEELFSVSEAKDWVDVCKGWE